MGGLLAAANVGLLLAAIVLALGLLGIPQSRDGWRARYMEALEELAAATAERDSLLPWTMHGSPPSWVVEIRDGICRGEEIATGRIVENQDPVPVMQGAIDGLPAGGGKILLRAGTYVLSRSIEDGGRDFVIIQGEGWNTTLVIANNTKDTVLDVRGRTGWIVSDLAIDGNKENNEQRPGGVPNDMDQNGIHLFQTTHSRIVRCHVHDTVFHGINVHYESTDNVVEDCLVERCGSLGDYGASSGILVFSSSARNIVRRNRCLDNHARGIYISAYSSDCIISDNIVTGGSAEVAQGIIVMDNSDRVELRNNTIKDVPGNGIDVGNRYGPGYDGPIIVGNQVINPGGSGIWCGPGGANADVTRNYIRNPAVYGIWTQGTGGRITHNNIIGYGKAAVQADSGSTLVAENNEAR